MKWLGSEEEGVSEERAPLLLCSMVACWSRLHSFIDPTELLLGRGEAKMRAMANSGCKRFFSSSSSSSSFPKLFVTTPPSNFTQRIPKRMPCRLFSTAHEHETSTDAIEGEAIIKPRVIQLNYSCLMIHLVCNTSISFHNNPSFILIWSCVVLVKKPPLSRHPVIDEFGRSYGTGRRKTSVARVWVSEGCGQFSVNSLNWVDYFQPIQRIHIMAPFLVSHTAGAYDVWCTVKGGGMSGQAGAVRLGISRALQAFSPSHRVPLKRAGLITRDPRRVERKKPGQKKARKKFQWVKRWLFIFFFFIIIIEIWNHAYQYPVPTFTL